MPDRIIRNAIRCERCNTIVESIRRWGVVTCACGDVAVDGGRAYLRRMTFRDGATYEELSVTVAGDA